MLANALAAASMHCAKQPRSHAQLRYTAGPHL